MTQSADLVAASRAHGVRDPRLLEAIAAVPRAQFVPPDLAAHAYQDAPLPIPHGQVTTQPSLVTQMVEALELSSSDRVLEIGTVSGGRPPCSPASPARSGVSSAGRTSPAALACTSSAMPSTT